VVRSGNIDLNLAVLRSFGSSSFVWSNTTHVYGTNTWTGDAYYIGISNSGTNPSSSNLRWTGFPVRCLVYKLGDSLLGLLRYVKI